MTNEQLRQQASILEDLIEILWTAYRTANQLEKPYDTVGRKIFAGETNMHPAGAIDVAQQELYNIKQYLLVRDMQAEAEFKKEHYTFDAEEHWKEYDRRREEIYVEIFETV